MSDKPKRRAGEAAFAVILLLFSIAAFWQAYDISGFSGLSTAGMFPMLASAVMCIAALAIILNTFRKPAASRHLTDAAVQFLHAVTPLRHLLLLGLILAYVLAMPWLGFLVASGLFLFAAILLLWRRGFWMTLIVSLAALAVIHIVFRVVFQVVLPNGSLFRGMF